MLFRKRSLMKIPNKDLYMKQKTGNRPEIRRLQDSKRINSSFFPKTLSEVYILCKIIIYRKNHDIGS
jgi:hypothetical protein